MEETLKEQALPYDGEPKEDWEFIGMRYNESFWFRYYKTPSGIIYFTITKKKKRRDPWIDYREDEQKRGFAKRRFKRRGYER